MPPLTGRLALVTGASSGIGLATARRLAAEGVHLLLWARRGERLEAAAAELTVAHRVRVGVAVVDVRDRAAVQAAVDALAAAGTIPDILINNAGLAAGLAPVQEGDPDDWDRMIDTNLKGLLNVSRSLLPPMIARGRGHIVNIGSTAAHQVYPKGNVYNATKFGVRVLSEGMSLDLAGTPLRVSCVDPGHVETEFALVRYHGDAERARALYAGFQPLTADDVADLICYILRLPEHVNIPDVIITPAAQRSVHLIDRR